MSVCRNFLNPRVAFALISSPSSEGTTPARRPHGCGAIADESAMNGPDTSIGTGVRCESGPCSFPESPPGSDLFFLRADAIRIQIRRDPMTKPRPTPCSFERHGHRLPLARTLGCVALLALAIMVLASSARATSPTAPPELPAVQEAVAGLAVPFEENRGQFEPEVAYLAKTFAGALFVTRDGRLVYSLPGKAVETGTDDGATETRLARRQRPTEHGPGWALEERLLDARPLAPRGTTPAVTHVTRFTPKGTFQAETWQGVRLGEAWAGIEVELATRGRNFEKLFHVAPGADPEAIRVGLRGAEGVHVAADGRLIVGTGNGEIAYTAPVAWQEIAGERRPVAVRYALLAPTAGVEGSAYGFALDAYDRNHPLTIDPLIQSTYLGGSGYDYVNTLALAANGDVLVGGRVQSIDLPGTAGGVQPIHRGSYDSFIVRLSGDLTALRQGTYLGGSGWDEIHALAPAANGDVLIGGKTKSNDLPGTVGGAQPVHDGVAWGGFVARLSGDLTALRQSTYLGGSDDDRIRTLALAANGDVLVGGDARSTDLPGTAGGAQPAHGGGYDSGFVARLSGDLTVLRQSTYLGGGGERDDDNIYTMALAANGDVLVGGFTNSANLPGTAGGAQPAHSGGSYDGFVTRLAGDLTVLHQSTYLGGSGNDYAYALALATNGDVLVGGETYSSDLPGATGGAQPAIGGGSDGFVTRLSGDLTVLQQSTYLGGSYEDSIRALSLAANGDVLVGGTTGSSDLPGAAGGAQPSNGGGDSDGFVARLAGDLTALQQSTYLGGSGEDDVIALALAANGDVLAGGTTASTDLPGTAGGAQPNSGGSRDGFVARLTGDLRAASPQTITFPPQADQPFVANGTFPIDPEAT
ncbi:MAG TPA: hypothetical protein PKX99_00655, partial [Thermoanaerobaculia bacterium]|nr:hypothetical protein [Thermoanaerobaculia bacterium]